MTPYNGWQNENIECFINRKNTCQYRPPHATLDRPLHRIGNPLQHESRRMYLLYPIDEIAAQCPRLLLPMLNPWKGTTDHLQPYHVPIRTVRVSVYVLGLRDEFVYVHDDDLVVDARVGRLHFISDDAVDAAR